MHDRSYGFYRRQIILTAKDIAPGRVDDPYLIEKLKKEADDIFLWCLEGLKRLLKNNYRFILSERTNRNLHEAMEAGNNIIAFMKSVGYIRLETNTTATSKNLYQAYCRWCEDNAEKPMGAKSFSGYLKENEKKYNIKYSKAAFRAKLKKNVQLVKEREQNRKVQKKDRGQGNGAAEAAPFF